MAESSGHGSHGSASRPMASDSEEDSTPVDVVVSDLTLLSEVSDDRCASVLVSRHIQKHMYTRVGPILIAVNPFAPLKPLPPLPSTLPSSDDDSNDGSATGASGGGLYTPAIAALYATAASADGGATFLPPHVFAVAASAMRALSSAGTGEPQVIIVAGESGAGKTEACRQVMQFVCLRSKTDTSSSSASASSTRPSTPRSKVNVRRTEVLSELLMRSSPLLEGFGNATTRRNRNSSRFGKFMVLSIDRTRFGVHSAQIDTYLLEKWRVARVRAGSDSTYHVFHYLLAGADEEYRRAWHLPPRASASGKPPEDAFRYTRGTASARHGGPEADAAGLAEIRDALAVACVSSEEVTIVTQLIAAILHLGNVAFYEDEDAGCARTIGYTPSSPASPDASTRQRTATKDGSESQKTDEFAVMADGKSAVEVAAELLGVEADRLATALVTKTVVAGRGGGRGRGSMHQQKLSTSQAEVSRDSLACAMYQRLFSWVVASINRAASTEASSVGAGEASNTAWLARLSILDIYGFEVFPENEFNQLCINYVNEKLQQIFVERTLRAEQEEYAREGIPWEHVDYFDNAGVCELLEGTTPKAPSILALLDEQCAFSSATPDAWVRSLNSGLGSSSFLRLPKGDRATSFTVVHYAGHVSYDASGFIEANRDTLNPDLVEVALESRFPFVCALFADAAEASRSGKRPPSAGSQFRLQVQGLAKTLRASEPHYIRCIKPNAEAAPAPKVDRNMILEQVRHLGIAENTRLRQGGYALRIPYSAFRQRFGVLLSTSTTSSSTKELCRIICMQPRETVPNEAPPPRFVENEGFRMGATKIFIRRAADVQALEAARISRQERLITALQAYQRAKIYRKRFLQKRACAIGIQATMRRLLAQRYAHKRRATIKLLQDYARVKAARVYFLKWRRAIRTMQRHTRFWILRGRCRKHIGLMIRIQARARKVNCRRRYVSDRSAIIRAQSFARTRIQRRQFLRAKVALSRLSATHRARVQRRKYLTDRHLIIRTQAIAKQGIATRRLNASRAAVTRISASARGLMARKEYRRTRRSVVYLQACEKRNAQRRRYEHTRACISRLAATRKAIVQRRAFVRDMAVCVWMQACLRRTLYRRRYRHLMETIERLQANARGFLARQAYRHDVACMVGLQARYRGNQDRRYANHRRDCLKVVRCVAKVLLFVVRMSWRRKELQRRMELEELRRLEHAMQKRVRRLRDGWHLLCDKLRADPVLRASVSMNHTVTSMTINSTKAKACGLSGMCWTIAPHHASLKSLLPKTFAEDSVQMNVGFYDKVNHVGVASSASRTKTMTSSSSRIMLCINKLALDNLIGTLGEESAEEFAASFSPQPRSAARQQIRRQIPADDGGDSRRPTTPRRLRADEVAPEEAHYLPLAPYQRIAKDAGSSWGSPLQRDSARKEVIRERGRRHAEGLQLSSMDSPSSALAPNLFRWSGLTHAGAPDSPPSFLASPQPTTPAGVGRMIGRSPGGGKLNRGTPTPKLWSEHGSKQTKPKPSATSPLQQLRDAVLSGDAQRTLSGKGVRGEVGQQRRRAY